MAKSNSKRQKRTDKFPLNLYLIGQYCKKIKNKMLYIGAGRKPQEDASNKRRMHTSLNIGIYGIIITSFYAL